MPFPFRRSNARRVLSGFAPHLTAGLVFAFSLCLQGNPATAQSELTESETLESESVSETSESETSESESSEFYELKTYAADDTVRVRGRRDDLKGIAVSASRITVSADDFRLRPLVREGELLETNPGMITTQHSGDGKSNQMFLRGFNLDHGTDFSSAVEGMPVNMRTHGHGQGYTDLNFIIPEFVNEIDFTKGVYDASIGDFGSAGSARFHIADELPASFFKVEGGNDRFRRAVVGTSKSTPDGTLLFGASVKGYDGPWDKPQDLKKAAALVRYSWNRPGGDRLSLLAMAYDNQWQSSDQIPDRLVENGTVSRFGQIDNTLGGSSHRYSLSLDWHKVGRSGAAYSADVYAIDAEMDLYSNFTYFAADSINGDQIEQVDRRTVLGGSFRHLRPLNWAGRSHLLTAGLETRTDIIREVGLHQSRARQRFATINDGSVLQFSTGLFAKAKTKWGEKLRTEVGLRGDFFAHDVDADREVNSGTGSDFAASPKFSLAYASSETVEWYLNGGLGFHSNDVRGTTIEVDPVSGEEVEPVELLVQSRGAEFGVRLDPFRYSLEAYRSTATVWILEMDSELVFVGDGGTTEPSDKSLRYGFEWTNFVRLNETVSVDFDLALAHARFQDVGDDDRIPNALENVIAAGVMWDLYNGFFGAVRLRHLGSHPLNEDNSVRGNPTTLANANFGYRFFGLSAAISILNITDETDSDIQYFYGSRLQNEAGPEIEDRHFHPVEPRQVRFALSTEF